ncbi:MAG: hypothetical protein JO047_15460 [Alphaproteobacteria bacterium]|nr:hypothetical protein [Alphaproteobacteria bacterium]
MTNPTPQQNDWIRDALNVDPAVFTPPTPDAEDRLGQGRIAFCDDVVNLARDFSNQAHEAAKRAMSAYYDMEAMGTVAWRLDDARGGAQALARGAPQMSREDRAILESDAANIDQANAFLRHLYDDAEAALNTYQAATRELHNLPQPVDAPPADDPPSALDGNAREHIWDFINQVTQMVLKLSDLHLIAGTDLIKDAIKADDTDKQVAAIKTQLETQRGAVNDLIAATRARASDDARNALVDYGHKLAAMGEQMTAVQAAIDRYAHHLADFTRGAGRAAPNPDAEKVVTTYQCVIAAHLAFANAQQLLNSPTLGPTAYGRWVSLLVPLGMPVTVDANTGGASVFEKAGVQTRYPLTAQMMEALASGMELVRDLYQATPQLDRLFADWRAAMQNAGSTAAPAHAAH